MYVCCKCKGQFEIEPSMTNGAGSFCLDCRDSNLMAAREAQIAKSSATAGICEYCGESCETKDCQGHWNHVCHSCITMRDRILKCIRYSDRVITYASKTEAREKDNRLARARQKTLNAQLSEEPSSTEARMLRIERSLSLLLEKIKG